MGGVRGRRLEVFERIWSPRASPGPEGGAISQFKSFGSSSKHDDIGPESFGIGVRRFVGTVPNILGLVWPSFRPNSDSKSKIPGRILKQKSGAF